jgi:4'-phosphopantetheinyl transferase
MVFSMTSQFSYPREWTPPAALSEGGVVVRRVAVDSPPAAAVARWYARLDREEQMHADRFRFAADREIYIAAHALTRALLEEVGGLPARVWRFDAGLNGKPEIDRTLGRPRLRFNLSHTHGLVVCAASLDCDLGVDVERANRDTNALKLAERFFAPDEIALLRGVAADRLGEMFLRIWTLKEAYIKATGRGLSCPLEAFAFSFDPVRIHFLPQIADDSAAWQFRQWRPAAGHVIAVASRGAAAPLRVVERTIDQQEL